MKKTIDQWAIHIIKRFGRHNALRYVNFTTSDCPCVYLNIDCDGCKFSPKIDSQLVLCDAAKEFSQISDNSNFINKLKEKIRKEVE